MSQVTQCRVSIEYLYASWNAEGLRHAECSLCCWVAGGRGIWILAFYDWTINSRKWCDHAICLRMLQTCSNSVVRLSESTLTFEFGWSILTTATPSLTSRLMFFLPKMKGESLENYTKSWNLMVFYCTMIYFIKNILKLNFAALNFQ